MSAAATISRLLATNSDFSAVLRLVRHRGERAGHALGPGGAAEPGAGDAHQAAGDDDADLTDQVGQHRALDPPRQGRAASPAGAPRAGLRRPGGRR